MKRNILIPIVLMLAGVATYAFFKKPSIEDPHAFMENKEKCDICHEVKWEGNNGMLEEEEFVVFFNDFCSDCHKKDIGRSHPVNVNPFKMVGKLKYPEELPLQFSETLNTEVMTCVTCHDLHRKKRFSEMKIFPRQEAADNGMYLTYYMRIRGKSHKEGFAPLCKACHPNI